jgi:hypothetical protein
VRIAFGKKLGGIQRAPLLHDAVHEEMIFTAKKDDIAATHVFKGDFPDQGNVVRTHPGQHAGTVNAQRNPAPALQGVRNAERIVRTAFAGDAIRF